MKKFTKGCLAAALVTFMIGIVLFGVGALFGGLRQLEHINVWNRTGIMWKLMESCMISGTKISIL